MDLEDPDAVWLVRHAESAGNVAALDAQARDAEEIAISARDPEVELTQKGVEQARATGHWLRSTGAAPSVIYTSPYERAHATARHLVDEAGWALPLRVDERLREKELGALNRLTKAGILARHPEEAARRRELGKFYYRPPLGESWCDVLLRLRSFWSDVRRLHAKERVMIVTHSAVVLCFRYLLEGLDERAILAIDDATRLANASVTSYAAQGKALTLTSFNVVAAPSTTYENRHG